MTNSNSILLFHRSNRNSQETLTHQQAFLEQSRKIIGSTRIINHEAGDHATGEELTFLAGKLKKYTVIYNSFFSEQEYSLRYDLYYYFQPLRDMGLASIYLMDSEGRLYKEVKKIKISSG